MKSLPVVAACMLVLLLAVRARAAEPVDRDWRKALEDGNHVEARSLLEASSASPSELHAAMRLLCSGHFDSDLAEWLIGKGVELDRLSEQGGTLLHDAARHHDTEAIKFLIDHRVDPNHRDSSGLTPLDDVEFPSSLYSSGSPSLIVFDRYPGISSNAFELLLRTTTNFTPPQPVESILHRSVLLPFSQPFHRLIKRDYPLDATNTLGETALMTAERFGRGEMFKELLEAGADPNVADTNGWTVLHDRVLMDFDGIVTSKRTAWGIVSDTAPKLMKQLPKGFKPVLNVYETNSYIGLLLAHGANPNARTASGQTPLHLLMSAERRRTTKLMAVAGPVIATPASAGSTPFATPLPSYSLGRRTHFGTAGFPSLLQVTVTNLLARLIDAGADVNARDHEGSTPLHVLAKSNRSNFGDGAYDPATAALVSQLIHQMVAAGANLEARDSQGRTPLLLAAEAVPATTPIWVKAGAKIDVLDSAGESALHRLVRTSFQDAVESLLQAGANLFERDRGGVTAFYVCYTNSALHHLAIASMEPGRRPLSDAILHGNLEQVRWYLNLDRRFAIGRHHPEFTVATPLVMAVRHQRLDVARVLLENGADPNTPDEPARSDQIAMLERPLADATRMALESNPKLLGQYVRMAREPLPSPYFKTGFAPLKEAAYLYVLNQLDPESDPATALAMVRLLLDHGARLNPAGDRTVTPAQALILQGQPELRRLIAGADDDPYEAALNGDVTLLAKLAAQDKRWLKPVPKGIVAAKPSDLGGLPEDLLLRVAARGHTDVVLFLLTNGVYAGPIKPLGHTPYFAAYTNAHAETARALRAKSGDFDIFSAIWSFDDAWLDQLITHRPELVNQATDFGMLPVHFGMLPVHAAAIAGNTNALERLVAAGADLNIPVRSSLPVNSTVKEIAFCTPLHLAVDHNQEATVRWLVEHKVHFNRVFSHVESPLGRSVARSNLPMTRYLLDRGARLNQPFMMDRTWRTPLDCANALPDSEKKTALIALLQEQGGRTVDELVKEGKIELPGP